MKNVFLHLSLVIALVVTSSAIAQEKEKKQKKNSRDPVKQMVQTLLKGLEPAELSDEQKKEVEELYTKVAKDVVAKRKEAELPANIFKQRSEASKEAREAGKKGDELQAAIDAKLGLTDAQAKCWKETTEIVSKAKLSVGKLLKAEQIAKVEKPLQTALSGKSEGGKKKKKADA